MVGLVADTTSALWAYGKAAVGAYSHSYPNGYRSSAVVARMLFTLHMLVESDTLGIGPSITAIHFSP